MITPDLKSKTLKKNILKLYELKRQIDKLETQEEALANDIKKVLPNGQFVVGKFRVQKTFFDPCVIPSFTRGSYCSLTISKI